MDRVSSFLLRKSDSFSSLMTLKEEAYLPISTKPQPKIRFKALLGHCLYRRVVVWGFVIIVLLSVALFSPHLSQRSRDVLGQLGKGHLEEPTATAVPDGQLQKQEGQSDDEQALPTAEGSQSEEEQSDEQQEENNMHWLNYKHLDGYFSGLRALVPPAEHTAEYPLGAGAETPTIQVSSALSTSMPTPTPYMAHPDYASEQYKSEYESVKPCYVDSEKKIPAPDLFAYSGAPQGQAKPAIGAYDIFGIRDDVCFDRFGRYGAYGLGYSLDEGGTGEGLDTEQDGSGAIWEKTGKINWDTVDWASAQKQCFNDNERRFFTGNKTIDEQHEKSLPKKMDRQAVVIRTYVGFTWTAHAVLNFRALITELNLRSGGEYDVHFLLHVRDDNAPIWADPETAQSILDANVPPEFHGICTLWSEAQMKLFYPGDFGETYEDPSGNDIHGVYRSAHMPLQHFAQLHPEYAHFWNWEMDMRWTGSYYELFDKLGKWGAKQSRKGMWERASKYYIPALHGDWNNFTEIVERETAESGRRPVMGPVIFAGKTPIKGFEDGFMPSSCSVGSDEKECGVGEDADLITLNPLFDVDNSGWVFAGDVTGYETKYTIPPRRCAIVTASRLSRRLLNVMHEETWRLHHSMFSEMFPPTAAFHHGLKAVYAPHPVYLDRAWPVEEIDKAFNGGRDHTSGGHGSPFDLDNEHNHKGTTWYYNSEFAGLLWRRWLGYAQMDGRGSDGGRSGEGTERGGVEEESSTASSGRLCLRSMLVHPIKWENPAERD